MARTLLAQSADRHLVSFTKTREHVFSCIRERADKQKLGLYLQESVSRLGHDDLLRDYAFNPYGQLKLTCRVGNFHVEVFATLDTFGVIPERFTCENDGMVLGVRQVAKLDALRVIVHIAVCAVEEVSRHIGSCLKRGGARSRLSAAEAVTPQRYTRKPRAYD